MRVGLTGGLDRDALQDLGTRFCCSDILKVSISSYNLAISQVAHSENYHYNAPVLIEWCHRRLPYTDRAAQKSTKYSVNGKHN